MARPHPQPNRFRKDSGVLSSPALLSATAGALALGSAALFVHARAREAEAENPPRGRFLDVDGVRLHYVMHGKGHPIVLLHGNGALVRDFELSGLVSALARKHRVIAFDRPGYGYSTRPRDRSWTPERQAGLLATALRDLGIPPAIVLGHSWGTLVALALAMNHPERVSRLVLLSGYFYPTPRADVALMSPPAIPILGDVIRWTISPLVSRLLWRGLIRKLFSPNPVSRKFECFPIWMTLRPSQLRAAAAESAMMIPAAARLSKRYRRLNIPTLIMAGEDDLLVIASHHSARLHKELAGSELSLLDQVGHMIHHVATAEVAHAIEEFASDERLIVESVTT